LTGTTSPARHFYGWATPAGPCWTCVRVLRGLLDAVIAAPQINFPEALLALAKTLAGQA